LEGQDPTPATAEPGKIINWLKRQFIVLEFNLIFNTNKIKIIASISFEFELIAI